MYQAKCARPGDDRAIFNNKQHNKLTVGEWLNFHQNDKLVDHQTYCSTRK